MATSRMLLSIGIRTAENRKEPKLVMNLLLTRKPSVILIDI